MFSLPVPPSVNSAYGNRRGNGRGRYKTPAYKRWLKHADGLYYLQAIQRQPAIRGPFTVRIVLPKIRGDIDNKIKLLIDFLVSRKLTQDDKHMVKCSVESELRDGDMCWIEVREATNVGTS